MLEVSLAKKRDDNTIFFHSCVKQRSRRNSQLAMKVGDGLLKKIDAIRAEVTKFFINILWERVQFRPYLDVVPFSSLLEEEASSLSTKWV